MLKKKFLFVVMAVVFLGKLSAQDIPEGYYNNIDGKQLWELKTALNHILKNHNVLRYSDLWYYFHSTDQSEKDHRIVWDMYSNNVWYFESDPNKTTSGMEKEHSLPKSWWAEADYVTKYDAYSDLNHLFPADGPTNRAKSNYILDEVTGTPSFNNGRSKVGPSAHASKAFEPHTDYKGDFARAYFYMITCYEHYAQQWRAESLSMFNKETSQVLKDWAKVMLMKWHREDPVSQKEIVRNEAVYGFQGNRNPFIDFPDLAEYFWGDSTEVAFKLPDILKTENPTLLIPKPVNSEMYVGNIQKDSDLEVTVLVKGVGFKNNLTVRLRDNSSNYFSLVNTTIPYVLVNSEAGYSVKITYNPKEYGEHTTRLTLSGADIDGSISVPLKGICSENPESIVPIGSQYADVYSENGDIVYRSYAPSDRISIRDLQGSIVYQTICTSDWQRFSVPKSGVYIVQINQSARKILVK